MIPEPQRAYVLERFRSRAILRTLTPALALLLAVLRCYLENDFQFDRDTERKACAAIHRAARVFVSSEDVLQQLRSGVSDFRLIADVSRSGH
jgi:hypothetical protein